VQYRFERDDADLMLVKDYEPRPQLLSETLPEILCVLCVAAAHPLAGKLSVTLDQLHEHVELTVQDSSDQGDDRHMFGGERVFYLSDFSAKKRALAMGVGFGWMPTYLVESELRAGELREVQYSGGSRYRFNPMLVHRADRPLGRTGQHLVSLLRRYSLANAKPARRAVASQRIR
jgi:DNA-binding transcriptional LysR family regulator